MEQKKSKKRRAEMKKKIHSKVRINKRKRGEKRKKERVLLEGIEERNPNGNICLASV